MRMGPDQEYHAHGARSGSIMHMGPDHTVPCTQGQIRQYHAHGTKQKKMHKIILNNE